MYKKGVLKLSFYDKYIELCASVGKAPSVVAEEMGFHRSAVSNWKRRKNNPADATVQTVANYFKVARSYFDENPAKNIQTVDDLFVVASPNEKMDMAARLISSLTEEQQAAFIQRIMFKK